MRRSPDPSVADGRSACVPGYGSRDDSGMPYSVPVRAAIRFRTPATSVTTRPDLTRLAGRGGARDFL